MTKRRIFIILLALTLFTSSLLNAAPVYASASEDTESPETVSDLKADQETDADAESEEPDTGKFDSIAEAAILIEASTGKVLYEKMPMRQCLRPA